MASQPSRAWWRPGASRRPPAACEFRSPPRAPTFSGSRNGSACDCSIVRRAESRSQRLVPYTIGIAPASSPKRNPPSRQRARCSVSRGGCCRFPLPTRSARCTLRRPFPSFLPRFPGLAIDISLSPRHVDLVQEGLDLAIRIGTLKDSPLVVRRLAPSRFVLCAAPAYLKMRGVPRVADDLLRHACFGVSVMPWGDEWASCQRQGRAQDCGPRSPSQQQRRHSACSGFERPRHRPLAELGGRGRPTVRGADAHIARM
jgi:LysR substrate binding domain